MTKQFLEVKDNEALEKLSKVDIAKYLKRMSTYRI